MKHRVLWMATLFVSAVLPCRPAFSAAAVASELYVASDGADGNPGTKAKPFATLERARDAIRALKKGGLPRGGVTVWIRGGVHYRDRTFQLGKEDSGTETSPVVYRAYRNERVWLSGGREVEASHFKPVTDPAVLARVGEQARPELLQLDVEAAGITDYLHELPDTFSYKAPSHGHSGENFRGDPNLLEVFCNGGRMPLARWPNEGFALYEKPVAGVRDFTRLGDRPKAASFQYRGERPARWKVEDGVWLKGYWGRAYQCSILKVGNIDAAKRQIDLAAAPHYGTGPEGGRRFFAFNLLEELDAPGEWYLDREKGTLYLWPPAALEECDFSISRLKSPIVSMRDASHVTMRGVGFECGRQDAVTVHGGAHNRLVACEIRNVGGNAVDVLGGTDHGVIGCDIHHIGGRGVTLMGGDRQSLTPGNHVALNNHIHHTSQMWRTHAGAITLRGVGCRAAHNLIHHDPHVAVWYWGNDHLVEYNEIHSVLTETTESGVLYSYNEWTFRGNVLRHNYVHHINDAIEGCLSEDVVLHLDGAVSGTTFTGNVCYRVGQVVKHNGGPGNTIENNLFIDAKQGVGTSAVGLDAWTYEPMKDGKVFRTRKSDGLRYDVMRVKNRESVPFDEPPYTKYPHLANLLKRDPIGAPWHCLIARNVFTGGRQFLNVRNELRREDWIRIEDNWDEGDPGFVDLEGGDFRPIPDSPVWKLGFKPIPFDKIGLYGDETRASWPVNAEQPPKDWKPRWMLLREQEEQLFTGRLPVFGAKRAWGKIEIDGDVDAQEWNPEVVGGAPVETHEPARLQWGTDGREVQYPSVAWIEVDNAHLYVAFLNDVDPTKGVTGGQRWGRDDAVEIALAEMGSSKLGPVMILQGYSNGHWESSDAGGASQRVVKRVAEGVEYATSVVDAGHWTAEWKVPFTSLGIDPTKRNPRLLFNLSARKPRSDLWAMWMKAPGAFTFDVRQGGLLWLSPFGNVVFSNYAVPRAVIDVDGRKDAVVMEPVGGCQHYPARWVKPRGSYLRGQTGDLTSGAWQDFKVAFTPLRDGVVSLHIRGRPHASAADNKLLPVWVYVDDIVVQGAALTNGGFEETDARGLPAGWDHFLPSHSPLLPFLVKGEESAHTGKHCVKVWYNGAFSHRLSVKEGQKVTVSATVRGEARR